MTVMKLEFYNWFKGKAVLVTQLDTSFDWFLDNFQLWLF